LIVPSLREVPRDRFRELEFHRRVVIGGVEVMLLPANHCPGAAQFLISPPQGGNILHTGDFRWDRELMMPLLKAVTPIDRLYLDTTFISEKHSFPPQATVIEAVVERVRQEFQGKGKRVVLFGAYTVGKERIAAAVARSLGLTVQVDPFKKSLLDCITADDEIDTRDYAAIFKTEPSLLRLVGMGDLNVAAMRRIAADEKCERVLAVIPTGWEHEKSKGELIRVEESTKCLKIHVAYSEHSSFTELVDCVEQLRPKQITPTVGVKTAEDARIMVERLRRKRQ
jgi:DNA cross-link repair 1A protein